MYLHNLLLFLLPSILCHQLSSGLGHPRYECGEHGRFEYCIDGVPGCIVGCHCHPGYYFDTETKICEPNAKLVEEYRRLYLPEPTRVQIPMTPPEAAETLPTPTTVSSIDNQVDAIAKDTDDLGDWLYNQFFKTIESQVINGTEKNDKNKPPTRRSGTGAKSKKFRRKMKSSGRLKIKNNDLRRKLLRITEDDSLFDSNSNSEETNSDSSSSDSRSDTTQEENTDNKEHRNDKEHGHRKIVVINKKPKAALPSFIFLPSLDTPFYPPIGLPPPPAIPMYPMIPVPPVPIPYPPGPDKTTEKSEKATKHPKDENKKDTHKKDTHKKDSDKKDDDKKDDDKKDDDKKDDDKKDDDKKDDDKKDDDKKDDDKKDDDEKDDDKKDDDKKDDDKKDDDKKDDDKKGDDKKDDDKKDDDKKGDDKKTDGEAGRMMKAALRSKQRGQRKKILRQLQKKMQFPSFNGFSPPRNPKSPKPSMRSNSETPLVPSFIQEMTGPEEFKTNPIDEEPPEDVDFKYLSQLIHKVDPGITREELNKNINGIKAPPKPQRRTFETRYYNRHGTPLQQNQLVQNQFGQNQPEQSQRGQNQLGQNQHVQNQPGQNLPYQSQSEQNYLRPRQPEQNQVTTNYRPEKLEPDDSYYANLGQQIANLIRKIDSVGERQVNIEIEPRQNTPTQPIFNENSYAPRSYWERSVRSPLHQFRHSGEIDVIQNNLFNLENKVETVATTEHALSLREIENVLFLMDKISNSKTVSSNQQIENKTKKREQNQHINTHNGNLNINLLPPLNDIKIKTRRKNKKPKQSEEQNVNDVTEKVNNETNSFEKYFSADNLNYNLRGVLMQNFRNAMEGNDVLKVKNISTLQNKTAKNKKVITDPFDQLSSKFMPSNRRPIQTVSKRPQTTIWTNRPQNQIRMKTPVQELSPRNIQIHITSKTHSGPKKLWVQIVPKKPQEIVPNKISIHSLHKTPQIRNIPNKYQLHITPDEYQNLRVPHKPQSNQVVSEQVLPFISNVKAAPVHETIPDTRGVTYQLTPMLNNLKQIMYISNDNKYGFEKEALPFELTGSHFEKPSSYFHHQLHHFNFFD